MHTQIYVANGNLGGLKSRCVKLHAAVIICQVCQGACCTFACCAGSDGGTSNVRHEETTMEAALKELSKTRNLMKAHLLRTRQDVDRRKNRAAILATTGGSPGWIFFVVSWSGLSPV